MNQLRARPPEKFDYAQGIASGGCTDLDMLWERNGHFLCIENKQPDEALSPGQLIALRTLNGSPRWTVWVVRGVPPADIRSAGPLDGDQHPMNVEKLRGRIQRWWNEHGKNPVERVPLRIAEPAATYDGWDAEAFAEQVADETFGATNRRRQGLSA